MITQVKITNYRIFRSFTFACGPDINIVVGDNESGKSTLLEAINLGLTRRLNGKAIDAELTPHLFNQETCRLYVDGIKNGSNPDLPKILIEIFFADEPALATLKGLHNSDHSDVPGVTLEVAFDDTYAAEYQAFVEQKEEVRTVPVEFYRVNWQSFADAGVTARGMPVRASFIDASTLRLQSGTDYYLQSIISEGLKPKERAALALAYRQLKELFGDQPSIKAINTKMTGAPTHLSSRKLSLSMDLSPARSWEASLTPHLDEIPFNLLGKGEQNALKILLALNRKGAESQVILVEEPENHLSHSSMHKLLQRVHDSCAGKQLIITTHSAFVANKLGLDKVTLLANQNTTTLAALTPSTREYFHKLPGYDTLRIILASRSILVEGPSDELVVQRAYKKTHGKWAEADGVDVISVSGLAFKRFLEIAKALSLTTAVVTDNDGNYEKRVTDKYADYSESGAILICADSDNQLRTLEDHILKHNDRTTLNGIFGTTYSTDAEILEYMKENKTEWALAVYAAASEIDYPPYVLAAIS